MTLLDSADSAPTLHQGFTIALSVAVTVLGWFGQDLIRGLRRAVQDQQRIFDNEIKTLSAKIDDANDKTMIEVKERSTELWAKVNKMDDSNNTEFKKLNADLHIMKEELIDSISNLKLYISNINKK